MRATANLLITLALSLTALGLALAAPGGGDEEHARAALVAASGSVRIANSLEGQAIFSAAAMRPGDGVTGTVRIANTGDDRGIFVLRATGLRDAPGEYGGLLSDQVELVLVDVTDVDAPVTVYAGRPSRLEEIALGTFAAGARRDYLVTVSLPDNGDPGTPYGGDNRYQGSSLSLGLQWGAVADPVATPTPTPSATTPPVTPPAPTATPAPTVTPAPTTPPTVTEPPTTVVPPVALADALGLPSSRTCVKRGRLTLRLKAPGGAKVLSATVKVNKRVKARLKGAKAARPVTLRGLKTKTTLALTIKASNGRTYSASRTYAGCRR
jgi:hypothetical protein